VASLCQLRLVLDYSTQVIFSDPVSIYVESTPNSLEDSDFETNPIAVSVSEPFLFYPAEDTNKGLCTSSVSEWELPPGNPQNANVIKHLLTEYFTAFVQ
jgi:hypothetical protein